MRIAIIASGFLPVIDGVTVSGLRRLEQLSAMGHEVLFFCPDLSPYAHLYPNWREFRGNILPGVEVVTLPSIPFIGTDYDRNVSWKSHDALMERMKKFKPDVIHVDEPERLFLGFYRRAGLKYAKQAQIPCVSFFRTNFVDYFEDAFSLPKLALAAVEFVFLKLLLYVYNSYDATLVSSTVTDAKLQKLGIKNTILSELHGVDLHQFGPHLREPDYFKSKFGISGLEKTVKLVFVGRLTPDKNWRFTFDALSQCAQQGLLNNVSVIIAGDGEMRAEIEDKMRAILPRVHLLGRVSPQDLPALMANCDVHVTTSEKETRGLTILEAFVSGIPVLAPNAGGVVQNISHGKNGFLYAPGSVADFTEKLSMLVADNALRTTMGKQALTGSGLVTWKDAVYNLTQIWLGQIQKKKNLNAAQT
jgi:glycosyltransferase involved in cell wall biosynthesis